jgi:hypothetical protein
MILQYKLILLIVVLSLICFVVAKKHKHGPKANDDKDDISIEEDVTEETVTEEEDTTEEDATEEDVATAGKLIFYTASIHIILILILILLY